MTSKQKHFTVSLHDIKARNKKKNAFGKKVGIWAGKRMQPTMKTL